jgi:hypothetical protein
MANSKTSKKSSVTSETEITAEEILLTLKSYASKSGVALKQSTVDNGGVYPIVCKDNGASVVTRLALLTLLNQGKIKTVSERVEAKMFKETLNSPEFVPLTSAVDTILGNTEETKWKNFNIFRSRINKEISQGHTVAFQLNGTEEWVEGWSKYLTPKAPAPKKPASKK